MKILGISAFYHDAAAAIVCDGEIVAAAQEERFTRRKHDAAFPANAIRYCLDQADISADGLDYVAFYEKSLQKFDRLLETYLAFAPAGFASFCQAIPLWMKEKLRLKRCLRQGIGDAYTGPIVFPEHHQSHAASAFYPSPFAESAIVTVDGVGEWATASIGIGRGNRVELVKELRFPHSLGLLYSAFTYYCGFKVNSGEYKLMGLAPYGRPVYRDRILEHLVKVFDDGSLWLDMRYFNYCQGLTMTSSRFHELLGGPPRKPESQLEQHHMDLAASIQAVTEEVMEKMCRYARAETGISTLCLAGGVALNCVANGKLLRGGVFDDIFIQPAAGDAGGALGAALFVWHHLLERPRTPVTPDAQAGSLLGPRFTDRQVADFLAGTDARSHRFEDEAALLDTVAECLEQGNVVGWFQGRMEYGPRALGCRSIIGDARSTEMQSTMNLKIKYRESFRPFAPCVLAERVEDYFDLDRPSPYMLLVADVQHRHRRALTPEEATAMADPDLRKRVHVPRSTVPAITHVDYSARVQTVDEPRHGRYYRLMKRFEARTGCPVIINTSFNIRGEPIVHAPRDAYNCFLNTEMDVLVMENHVLYKHEQPERDAAHRAEYRSTFKLD